MKVPGGTHSPDSSEPRLHRLTAKKQSITGVGIRLRKYGTPAGKSSALATPLLKWKFDDGGFSAAGHDEPVTGRLCFRRERGGGETSVSARKLAAGLWQLQVVAHVAAGGRGGGAKGRRVQCRPSDRLGLERGIGHVKNAFPCHCDSRECGAESKDLLQSTSSISGPRNGILSKLESSLSFPKSAMEGATKWDPGCQKTSDEVYHFYSRMKVFEDHHVSTVSVVSALQAELVKAQTRVQKLEAERQSARNKFEHFLKKLGEERTSWQRREHEKIRVIVDDLKDELKRERKNCQRMEIINSKLVSELADAKLSAKQLMQEYEKERKARELMEEVCNELAKEIAEDKAEVEALKRESLKIHEDVEEERKMLQMAEVWREERVQMKLVDAKLTLEHKYRQMSKLIADLEAFLGSRSATSDAMELRKAELIQQAANSVKIQDVKEFSYVAPNSYDIFSIIKELQNVEADEKEIDPCVNYHPASCASKIHILSPDNNGLEKNPVQRHSVGFVVHDKGLEEEASAREIVSDAEDQGSIYSPKGTDLSVNRISQGKEVSRVGREWDENAGQDSPRTEISEVRLVSAKQSNQKGSFASKIQRPCPSNGEVDKIISAETNGRLSNGTVSNVENISPDRDSVEGGIGHNDSVVQWSSPDSVNPHITRGMKGCIECPQGIQKNSLKAKLLEARMESRKIQLRHVLRQKS